VYLAVQSLIEGCRFRPDIIHGHMHEGALIGGLLARLLRVPLVFDFQGSLTAEMVDHQFLDPNGRLFRWVYRAERFIDQRLPSAILTSSVQAGRMLQTDFQVNPEIIKPLPDCADTERFRPDLLAPGASKNLRLALGIPEDRLIVAYLGLLTDYQGIPQLIETAAKLNQTGDAIHFLVMGYPNVDLYRGLADSAGVGDRMTFTGKIEYRDAATYLGLGDIAVAPKMSTSEGSGKLLNYMAMAQPVVAFDTPVHREYLAELGIYAPVGNTSAFAAAIRQLMNNPGQRASLGQQLRQRAADQYSWREAGQEIEQIYSQLTS
ncbi:MAG: glycosyltransferase family 4 protein, partial [Anaerolineaceae bacterium]